MSKKMIQTSSDTLFTLYVLLTLRCILFYCKCLSRSMYNPSVWTMHVFLEWQKAFLKTGYPTLDNFFFIQRMYFRRQDIKNPKHESNHAYCWDIQYVHQLSNHWPQNISRDKMVLLRTDHWPLFGDGEPKMDYLWHRWENPLILRSVVGC